ncbi:phosphopyruvate hydratase [Microbacterium sp. NPDC058062]|uniref:phosphopyruvate hydratase n=1 Tax=Microbacterium sp. NPDC058062 TaxID=3346320 RepID=UPI0036D7F1FE
MTRITGIRAREILDSRGRPTVQADVALDSGRVATASVPSGASTGRHEAVELRDGDSGRFGGRGVLEAVRNVNEIIAPALVGLSPEISAVDQRMRELDGTDDKSALGANAILAVSLATARAQAISSGRSLWQVFAGESIPDLPLPMVNILSGGLHAGRQIDFQDFLVVPVGAADYPEALEWVVAVHEAMGTALTTRGLSTLRADEGGYGPSIGGSEEALELMDEAVARAGLEPGSQIVYAIDVAATHFFDPAEEIYRVAGAELTSEEMVEMLADLTDRFAIASLEDGLAEDDWSGWRRLQARLGGRVQIIGDDHFTTNPQRVGRGIAEATANAVLVKMNQIGTISETLDVISQARKAGWRTVVSARSGETEDAALADLAFGTGAGQIKVGSVTQSERLAKYNRLLVLQDRLGERASLSRALGPVGEGNR